MIDRETTGESEVQGPKSGGEVLPISQSTFPAGSGIGRSVFDLPAFLWFSVFTSRADMPRFHEHSGGCWLKKDYTTGALPIQDTIELS